MPSAFRPMLLRGISAVSSALTTIWPPRSPCRSRLHDELVNSAQKNRRTRLRPPNMCQGQHRTMQQEHARWFLREALIQSARTDGERFFGKARYGKRRNTLCTRKGHAASVRRQGRRCGGLFNAKGNPDGFLSHYPSLRDFRLGRFFDSLRRQSRQRLRNISSFSYRWIGKKYPAKAADAIVRGCPN